LAIAGIRNFPFHRRSLGSHLVSDWHQQLHEVSEEMLANDRIRRMALERCFEIISIASYHIPSSLKAAGDGVDWQAIADIGDRLENTRDRVEAVLCTTWRDKVMPLKACAKRHLAELR
jgi:uncharacterized protein with HEPN domain